MAKAKRGLPEGFDLDVGPVSIGDYLDEEPGLFSPGPKAAEKIVDIPLKEDAPNKKKMKKKKEPKNEAISSPARRKPPRLEFNMKPDTQDRYESLLRYVQTYGPQSDTKGSEVLSALIHVLDRAKDNLELGSVPKRGRWGTPTAKAFRDELAYAFERAISKSFKE